MRPLLHTINIKGNEGKQTLALISTASFTIVGGVLIYFGIYFLGGAVLFGGGYGFFAIKKTTYQAKSLVQLDVKGLNINMPNMEVSLLWNEIDYCCLGSIVGINQILVFVKKPDEILNNLNLSKTKKKLYAESIRDLGTFIFFPTNILDIKTEELVELIEDYRKAKTNND